MHLRKVCYLPSVLEFLGSVSAPDDAILKDEAHALQCTTTGTYSAFPSDPIRVGSLCGLGSDILGIQHFKGKAFQGKRSKMLGFEFEESGYFRKVAPPG